MIKDNITPELKRAVLENIAKTKDTNKEHGFYMCIENGKLFPSKIKCEGTLCGISTEIQKDTCPGKIQGFFHAHPHKLLLEAIMKRKISEEEIKELLSRESVKERAKSLGITVQSPSHRDVLSSFINRCEGHTEGTSCTGSDLETNKIECWTPKKNSANFLTCSHAKVDNILTMKIGDIPKKWITSLFDKENITLNKSNSAKIMR